MADATTKNPAPANTDAGAKATNRKRSQPKRAGKVNGIPKTAKNSHWAVEIESLRQEPGETYKYEDVSQTTGSYLAKTYGVIAATRNNTSDGRADLYLQYPAKAGPNGTTVPDEDEVKRIKAQYDKG